MDSALRIFIIQAADIGNDGHGIVPKVGTQIPVGQIFGFGVQDLEVGAVVAQTRNAADAQCLGQIFGQGGGVGGSPLGRDAAQRRDLIGISVVSVHGVSSRGVNSFVHQSAPQEVADLNLAGPISGRVGVKDGSHASAALVPNNAAELNIGGHFDLDADFASQPGFRNGGNDDGGLPDADTGDHAVLHGGDALIRGLPSDLLVGQGPGQDSYGNVSCLTAENRDLLGLDKQLGRNVGGIDQVGLAGHDDQAGAGVVEGRGGFGSVNGICSGRLAGLGVDLEDHVIDIGETVLSSGFVVIVADHIQLVVVVIPSHAAAQIAVVDAHFTVGGMVVHGRKVLNHTFGNHAQRELVEEDLGG